MNQAENLIDLNAGDRVSAGQWNLHNRLLRRLSTGPATMITSFGVFHRQLPTAVTLFRWAKLDGTLNAGGSVAALLWRGANGDWGEWDTNSGEDVTAYASPLLSSSLASGSWVLLMKLGNRWTVIEPSGSGTSFVVECSNDGGVAGSATPAVNCSFTYTVDDLDGVELGTAISPEHARYPNTTYLAAGSDGRSAYGIAFTHVTDGLVLLHLPGETQDTTVCA